MEQSLSSCDAEWWVLAAPAILKPEVVVLIAVAAIGFAVITWALSPGGPAWAHRRTRRGAVPIHGPRGFPVVGSLFALSRGLPHRRLAALAAANGAKNLMAFSVGATPYVVSSSPGVAKEILTHSDFADRPIKASARELMFARAIGFAPSGAYWRLLRSIASSHLFSPRRIAAHSPARCADVDAMIRSFSAELAVSGYVTLRPHLQAAALNNIMGSVFGRRYYGHNPEAETLQLMVREGFDLLGAFNWSDHLPWLASVFDPSSIKSRCAALVPRVRAFVKSIIDDHKLACRGHNPAIPDTADFVDVLLSLGGDQKLSEDDMIAVLWEMVFRGTDTVALLTEWAMAELVLNPSVQRRLREELRTSLPRNLSPSDFDAEVARLPYLQAVLKETLRAHPPGPLLSWARLSTLDVHLSNGMVVPAGTTAMVNMWAITHDPTIWSRPEAFQPVRFLPGGEGAGVDVRGLDLRLAPFGAGRRVCPGKSLGLTTAAMWVARLVQAFEWGNCPGAPVNLDELLKLSCEMKTPLTAVAVPVSL